MTRNFVSPEEIPLLRWEDSVSADRVTLVEDVNNPIVNKLVETNTLITSGNEILNSFQYDLKGFVSNLNSSTTTLSASGVFDGERELTNGYGIIYVSVFSDVESSINGLKILQSPNGIYWDKYNNYL